MGLTLNNALSALSLASAISAQHAPGVVHLPVSRTSHRPSFQQAVQRRASGDFSAVDLKNLDLAYTIDISIGGQTTSVVLDTGSSELWVDPDCSTASRAEMSTNTVDSDVTSPEYCESIGRYDPSSSSTAEALDEGAVFGYADDTTVEVDYYTDTIGIGNLTLSGQQFGVANASNATALGIMGMGPSSAYGYNLTQQPYSLILDSMVSQGQIASRTFSLDLRDLDNSTGSIIFGGVDTKKFLNMMEPVALDSVQMKGVSQTGEEVDFTNYGYYVQVGSTSMLKPNASAESNGNYENGHFTAVLDSGTSVLLVPEGLTSQICADLNGTEPEGGWDGSYCLVDCGVRQQNGSLSIGIEGKTSAIRIEWKNLLSESVQDGVSYCFLDVADSTVATDPPTYILGAPFLRASYLVFEWDKQKVHMAETADCGSEVTALGADGLGDRDWWGCQSSEFLASSVSVRSVMSATICALFVSAVFLI